MKNADFEKIKDDGVEQLEVALVKSGLPVIWAAERLDVTSTTIARLLTKKYRPSLEMAIAMIDLAKKIDKIVAAGL